MAVQYVITAIGAVAVLVIHFWGGRELMAWAPAAVGRVSAMVGTVAVRWADGAAVVIAVVWFG